jgi:hypothetical protein
VQLVANPQSPESTHLGTRPSPRTALASPTR